MAFGIAQFRGNMQVEPPPMKVEIHKASHLVMLIQPVVKNVLRLVFIPAIEDAMADIAFVPIVAVTDLLGPVYQCDLSASQIITLLICKWWLHRGFFHQCWIRGSQPARRSSAGLDDAKHPEGR